MRQRLEGGKGWRSRESEGAGALLGSGKGRWCIEEWKAGESVRKQLEREEGGGGVTNGATARGTETKGRGA